ncbi:hypothetical protein V6N12_069631 [Hibiscus sabdariffa]|uniref:Uncharacterized protein n=1 Tax=Hibiscus sabdariffa TaxID=183260 RepID=A0ABR2FEH0_9ROSI
MVWVRIKAPGDLNRNALSFSLKTHPQKERGAFASISTTNGFGFAGALVLGKNRGGWFSGFGSTDKIDRKGEIERSGFEQRMGGSGVGKGTKKKEGKIKT